jgi:Mn-containing catalase
VDGGEGDALVNLSSQEANLANKASARTASRTDKNPTTGADLGAGPGAGSTKLVEAR